MIAETCEPQAAATSLCGRDDELGRIDALLDGVRAARSGVLVLRGAAGTGKSALLDEARERAAGMCVLCCAGVEAEVELPFASLHQLIRPILSRIDALPEIQAGALRGALALGPAASEHRLVVAVAVLSLLAEAAAERPVLCLLDDAHRLDNASAEALSFVARRLGPERVGFLFTARDGDARDFEAHDLPMLRLGGLPTDAATALLDRHAPHALPHVREQMIQATAGNPLALIELAGMLSPAQRAGAEPLPDPVPVSARIERAFLARVHRLPEPTQTLLLVAAADDSGEFATILAAAARLGAGPEALDAAEAAGLARVRDARLQLRHPLLRSALFHGAPASRRRDAHSALADVLDDDAQADRRAWHLAAASVAPDPAVVAELEHAARRARDRCGYAAASLAYERAAALTLEDEQRAYQLAAAGENAWVAGRSERALALLEPARTLTAEPALRAHIDTIRSLIGLNAGVPADAAQLALRAAQRVAPTDGHGALKLLSIASLAATYACDGRAIAAIADTATRVEADDSATARLLAHQLRGLGAYYAGDYSQAAPLLRAALALTGPADAEASGRRSEVLFIAAAVGLFLGDDDAVGDLHRRLVARARDDGALGLLAWALPRLAVSDIWAGRWTPAVAGLTEAVRLGRALRQDVLVAYAVSELAIVAALRGEEEECRALAAESVSVADARGLPYVRYIADSALVALDLSLGRTDAAFARAGTFTAMPGLDFWEALDRIEAAVHAGEPAAAAALLARFTQWAQTSGSAWALPVARHCQALVADDGEPLFREALELHAASGRPFERARTQLAFGEFLRRNRRRKEAREHLRAALETFSRLGARAWAERARVALRASGQTARPRDASTIDDLTPQELQIAQRVAEGLTNRDIAAQLFLSPRTIDFHLRNVFRKLGLSSRFELVSLDLGG